MFQFKWFVLKCSFVTLKANQWIDFCFVICNKEMDTLASLIYNY